MLLQCPLVALDDRSAVLTGGRGDFPDPVGGSFSHQFPLGWVYVPSLLVTGECRGSCGESSLKATEEKGLPPQVLDFAGRDAHFLVPALVSIVPCSARFA